MTKYNLEERTVCFGEEIVKLCKNIPQGVISKPIISQLVDQVLAWVRIIWKPMARVPIKISEIRFLSVRKRSRKQSIG